MKAGDTPQGDAKARRPRSLVYSCSGCSSAAQMANQIALWMDREGLAEMSCIAGVGGGVPGLVRTAISGRPIVALDGCVMSCVAACLQRAEVKAELHITLNAFGVGKFKHQDFDRAEAMRIYRTEIEPRLRALAAD